jgi:hypothetical protein
VGYKIVSSRWQVNKKVICRTASNDVELGDPSSAASETSQQIPKK